MESSTPSPKKSFFINDQTITKPGPALGILRKLGARGQFIRKEHFRVLCKSARPNIPRDAHCILTAMKEFKRCSRFTLDETLAEDAVQGMIRSLGSDAGLVLGKAFVDENTGLYFSLKSIDDILKLMLEGEADEKVSRIMMNKLLARSSSCEWKLKKRARSKYLKLLQVRDGPTVETLDLAVKISVKQGAPINTIEKALIMPFEKWGRWQNLAAKAETKLILEKYRVTLEEQENVDIGEGAEQGTDTVEGKETQEATSVVN